MQLTLRINKTDPSMIEVIQLGRVPTLWGTLYEDTFDDEIRQALKREHEITVNVTLAEES